MGILCIIGVQGGLSKVRSFVFEVGAEAGSWEVSIVSHTEKLARAGIRRIFKREKRITGITLKKLGEVNCNNGRTKIVHERLTFEAGR